MALKQLFKESSFKEGSIGLLVKEIIDDKSTSLKTISHENTGEVALIAASKEVAPYLEKGGVVHYQRNVGKLSEVSFYNVVLTDLLFIERSFGQIIRLKSYTRQSDASKQIFLTIRLENQVIVQYGLNSLSELVPSFSFDFSSRGYNLDFDDQIQAPIRLNSVVLTDEEFTTGLTEKDQEILKRVWHLFESSVEGGN